MPNFEISRILTWNAILSDNVRNDVEGTIRFEGGNAIFKPKGDLKAGTKYTVKITKEVKSMTVDSLESDKEWSFMTRPI